MLTSGHCVFTSGGGEDSLEPRKWWSGADGVGAIMDGSPSAPYGYKNVQWYLTSTKYVDKGWESRDYAVLVLYDNSSSCGLTHFGYRVIRNSDQGDYFWSFGYPYFWQECPASSPLAGNACGGSMWGMNAQIDNTTLYYAYVDHDIQPGQSGSGIYDYNGGNRQIVAILKRDNNNNNNNNDNLAVKMRRRLFDFIEAARDEYPGNACN